MNVTINGQRLGKIPKLVRPIVGVALSGGGLRGTAHIGVLKALNDHRIPIDMISGTSAGAVIAAMYACGYNPLEMVAITKSLDLPSLVDLKITVSDLLKHGVQWFISGKFRFWSVLPTGLVKGEKIERFFQDMWQERTVQETRLPIAITAVDVNSGDTVFFNTALPGRREILNARYYHDSCLYDAVRSSISIPGVFFPKKYRGMTLVDGAVKNNLPTDILQQMGANVIIGVDLGYNGQPNENIQSVSELIMQSIEILGREVTLLKGEKYADIIIRPNIFDISYKDIKQIPACIDRGEQAALARIPEIKRLLRQ